MASKKDKKATPSEMRKDLFEHIMDGRDEESAERATRKYLADLSDDVVRGMYRRSILDPQERIEVVAACLKRCADAKGADADKFIDGLPGEWGTKQIRDLANELLGGDLVIEESEDDDED